MSILIQITTGTLLCILKKKRSGWQLVGNVVGNWLAMWLAMWLATGWQCGWQCGWQTLSTQKRSIVE
jgi:hypothetical protein